MFTHELTASSGLSKPGKRLGRGNASGKGNYSGKGCKGQNARKSGGVPPRFEGGQTPLFMRLPKLRGFKRPQGLAQDIQVVSLKRLEADSRISTKVTKELLASCGLIKDITSPVKILGADKLSKALEIEGVEYYSAGARAIIEKAGGSCA